MATIGDVVLIYFGDKPTFFARIDSITPDMKKDWFRVELMVLAVPLKSVTWILREEYVNGRPFTMEGNPVRIEPVRSRGAESPAEARKTVASPKDSAQERGKVIPFAKPKKGDGREKS
jgi:hypothetical protein